MHRLHRFFCPPENIHTENIIIADRKEVHHIVEVLRLKVNEKIIIFDGCGKEYLGALEEMKKKQITVKILSTNKLDKRGVVNITLACAIPKKGKFDYIVEKTTELGVDRIIPLESQRTVVSLDEKRQNIKLNHWKQVSINAAKQCTENFIPEITKVTKFSKVLSTVKDYDLCLFFCLSGRKKKIRDILESFKNGKILVFIGPEGDFSEEEIVLAKKAGCEFGSFGSRILKVDTAAISVISIINSLILT